MHYSNGIVTSLTLRISVSSLFSPKDSSNISQRFFFSFSIALSSDPSISKWRAWPYFKCWNVFHLSTLDFLLKKKKQGFHILCFKVEMAVKLEPWHTTSTWLFKSAQKTVLLISITTACSLMIFFISLSNLFWIIKKSK